MLWNKVLFFQMRKPEAKRLSDLACVSWEVSAARITTLLFDQVLKCQAPLTPCSVLLINKSIFSPVHPPSSGKKNVPRCAHRLLSSTFKDDVADSDLLLLCSGVTGKINRQPTQQATLALDTLGKVKKCPLAVSTAAGTISRDQHFLRQSPLEFAFPPEPS